MTKFQKAQRVDLAILDALWTSKSPVDLNTLYSRVCTHGTWVSLDSAAAWLRPLTAEGFVNTIQGADSSVPLYALTETGRKFLTLGENALKAQMFHEEQSSVTSCNHNEPEDNEPARALLCVDEDELDSWWDALEVEAKADAFAQWSLGNDGLNSHVYIERNSAAEIPVKGKVGETSQQWERIVERHSRAGATTGAAHA